ncbi:hypothetical protein N7457_007451 [Penicillium paradoxum]|uniref:uncharacterized protein n=1 Tax=Penicillium paradoxum TaxID=176176 RepID=UPI002546E23B|nr:uncharacterized protein N7457_007451 [Penicillium paradoxum]KAJ5779731.1 hypothetical protein N7457_007451 [Penicillium paradoxum]
MPPEKKIAKYQPASRARTPQSKLKVEEIYSALLPNDVFGERVLRASRFYDNYKYSNFINGKGKGEFKRNRAEYVPTWVIERNMSDEADQLLDLLENGIFDALLKGVLHAVQFTVMADKDSPNKVLESYTFTFENFGERGPADRRTNGPRMDFVSIHDDRASMRSMILDAKALTRRLITLCTESPPLPNERSLGVHIFYKPECPGLYDVSGFSDAQDDTIEYPQTAYWKRTTRFYGTIDSGFHTVGLRVNSLISTSPGGDAHFPSAEEVINHAVPRSKEVGIPTPAQMPLDVVGEITLSTDESTSNDSDGMYLRITISLFTLLKPAFCYSIKMRSSTSRRRGESRIQRRYTNNRLDERKFFQQEDVVSHQASAHERAKVWAEAAATGFSELSTEDYLKMRQDRPGRLKRARFPLNEPQEEEYATSSMSQDCIDLSVARLEAGLNFEPREYIARVQAAGPKPIVTKRTVEYVRNRRNSIEDIVIGSRDTKKSTASDELFSPTSVRRGRRKYRCECNTWSFKPSKSYEKIKCDSCNYHQHTLCYGYHSRGDPRIPDTHYCYSCLIGYDFDSKLMGDMIKLIRQRRTIHLMCNAQNFFRLNWHLARQLSMDTCHFAKLDIWNCTDDEARSTVHSLRKLGVVFAHPYWKNKIFHKLGEPKLMIRRTRSNCDVICSEILDPMLLIQEYYEIPPPGPQPIHSSLWRQISKTEEKPRPFRCESPEWINTADPRLRRTPWKRVRSNPSADGNLFEEHTLHSASIQMLSPSSDEEESGDDFAPIAYNILELVDPGGESSKTIK